VGQLGAAVVVNLVNLAFGGFYAVVVAVMAVVPPLTLWGVVAVAMVRPGLQDFRNVLLAVVKFEGDGDFDIPAGGDLYLTGEKTLRHIL